MHICTCYVEYAATYASLGKTGEHAMVLCMVVARNVYPISRHEDYAYPNKYQPGSVSRFHYQHPVPYCAATDTFDLETAGADRADKGLKAGFGACVCPMNYHPCLHDDDMPAMC